MGHIWHLVQMRQFMHLAIHFDGNEKIKMIVQVHFSRDFQEKSLYKPHNLLNRVFLARWNNFFGEFASLLYNNSSQSYRGRSCDHQNHCFGPANITQNLSIRQIWCTTMTTFLIRFIYCFHLSRLSYKPITKHAACFLFQRNPSLHKTQLSNNWDRAT